MNNLPGVHLHVISLLHADVRSHHCPILFQAYRSAPPLGPCLGWRRLMFESPSIEALSSPDNLAVSPRGGLILCEDSDAETQFLCDLTHDGRIFDFAEFLLNSREWAGATDSPDGASLFINIQGDAGSGGEGNLGYPFAI
jgi:hypothetical protein